VSLKHARHVERLNLIQNLKDVMVDIEQQEIDARFVIGN
tara:strand:+ start:1967 stop:2083 length:117 start_codon:yes stop_codon:yes gene_type:complete